MRLLSRVVAQLRDALPVNRVHPKKLLNSKWTAMAPVHRERHFVVTEVEFDDDRNVVSCVLQAVLSKREMAIDWRDLTHASKWTQGWLT